MLRALQAVAELFPGAIGRAAALQQAYAATDETRDGWIGPAEFRSLLQHLVRGLGGGADNVDPRQGRGVDPPAAAPRTPSLHEMGLLTQGGQEGLLAPLACRFSRILTHFPLILHGIYWKLSTFGPGLTGSYHPRHEIDELEDVYAQFVRTAPTADQDASPKAQSQKVSKGRQVGPEVGPPSAHFSRLSQYSHRNAWANLHLLRQPNTYLAAVARAHAGRGEPGLRDLPAGVGGLRPASRFGPRRNPFWGPRISRIDIL